MEGETNGDDQCRIQQQAAFEWEGTAEDLDKMEAPLKKLAESAGSTIGSITTSTVLHIARSGDFFSENQQFEVMAVVHYLLHQPTHHPAYGGQYRDYLPTWDFDFNIREVDAENAGKRRINITVEGTLSGITAAWPRIH